MVDPPAPPLPSPAAPPAPESTGPSNECVFKNAQASSLPSMSKGSPVNSASSFVLAFPAVAQSWIMPVTEIRIISLSGPLPLSHGPQYSLNDCESGSEGG